MTSNNDSPSRLEGRRIARFAFLVCLGLGLTTQARATVIGGFDLARGGIGSFPDHPGLQPGRDFVQANFPGTTFSSTNVLTASYLSTIDVLVISSAVTNTTHISPLSAAEQTALFDFVVAGNGAFIGSEREAQGGPTGDAARESMIDVFGMDTEGNSSATAATVTNLTHPVTNGPFGPLTFLPLTGSGWYSDLGPWATPLATEDTFGNPMLAVIDRNAIAPGSGPVIFLADMNVFDAFNPFDLENPVTRFFGNESAFLAVPEPSSIILAGLGLIGLVAYGRRRHGRRRRCDAR